MRISSIQVWPVLNSWRSDIDILDVYIYLSYTLYWYCL